jgi:peptide/nickel transport system substrate-binding protein
MLFFLIGFLFALPCSAQKAKAPKGAIAVTTLETFAMTGGDTHTSTGVGGNNISNMIHEGLIRKDNKGKIVPALAKSWEFSKDGLSMKFTLNEGAKFHNGEPVTANDVKFSIERVMRPELKFFVGQTIKNNIDRIEVSGDHQLTIYFKVPYPSFIDICCETLGILPKAYVEKVGDEEFAKHPIGAGPFKWVDYQQDVFVRAEAVPEGPLCKDSGV